MGETNNDYITFLMEHFSELNITVEENEQKEKTLFVDSDDFNESSKTKVRKIDLFPKLMGTESPHRILEVFYRQDAGKKERHEFDLHARKFFRTILLIISYSDEIIISSDCFSPAAYKKLLTKSEYAVLKDNVRTGVFPLNDEYEELAVLLKLSLMDRFSTTIYMPDLGTVIVVKDLFALVYSRDDRWDFIEKICMTEGLYLR